MSQSDKILMKLEYLRVYFLSAGNMHMVSRIDASIKYYLGVK